MARGDSEWEKVLKKSEPSHFLDELMFEILSRLPVKSIVRFKCVCKKWHELFGDSSFVAAHFNRSVEGSNCRYLVDDCLNASWNTGRVGYYLRDEKFEELCELPLVPEPLFHYDIVASVDGLICIKKIARDDRNYVLLWNPATRELRTLPQCPDSIYYAHSTTGFGFDLKNSDYKVVMMTLDGSQRVVVYSLRNDKWRSTEVDDYVVDDILGEYVNGRLHWLRSGGTSIVSFDLSTEKMISMGVPSSSLDLHDISMWYACPKSFGESLIVSLFRNEGVSEIWFMKKYGDANSWSKLYNFPPHPAFGYMRPFFILESGKVILLSCGTYRIVSYDPKNQVYKILNVGCDDNIFKYKESLLSVEGGRNFSNRNQ